MPAKNTPESFWRRVQRGDGCWLWLGSLDSSGYGNLGYQGRRRLAHRLAWELARGDLPEGLHVLHVCDEPRCCNPEHLRLGTHADNMGDMARKGRSLRGDRSPQAKLTAEQVRGVFKRRAEGATQSAIARDLCVDKSCISRILGGKAWTSLEAAPCSP